VEIWKSSAARIIGQQRRRYTQLPSSLFILLIFLFNIFFFSHTFVEFCVYYRAHSTNSTSSQDVGYKREEKKKKKTHFFFTFFSFDFLVATLPCSYRQMFPNSIFCVITGCGGGWGGRNNNMRKNAEYKQHGCANCWSRLLMRGQRAADCSACEPQQDSGHVKG
jgi:hypothetical protein